MARRRLLSEDERIRLFGVPTDQTSLLKYYSLTPEAVAAIDSKRGQANRLGFAVQLSLLGATTQKGSKRRFREHLTNAACSGDLILWPLR